MAKKIRRVSKELVEKILPLYDGGLSVYAVADETGCHFSTVYAALHQEGL